MYICSSYSINKRRWCRGGISRSWCGCGRWRRERGRCFKCGEGLCCWYTRTKTSRTRSRSLREKGTCDWSLVTRRMGGLWSAREGYTRIVACRAQFVCFVCSFAISRSVFFIGRGTGDVAGKVTRRWLERCKWCKWCIMRSRTGK
jgi:hypothetical protein